MRPSRRTSLLRGAVGASAATFVALASHVWVGGGMPGMLGIAVPWLLSLVVCTLLAGRRLSVIRLGLAVAISQFLFHALFVLGAVTPTGGIAPHVHGSAPIVLPGGALAVVPQDTGMWLAHGAAAIVTIVLLHQGERTLHALLFAAAALRAWLRSVLPVVRPVLASPFRPRWAVVPAALPYEAPQAVVRRRGPPRGV